MIEFQEVSVSYDGRPVSPPFSLRVARGERVGLAGESGSGKTTLLKVAARLLLANAEVAGQCRASGRIGYVPQQALDSLSPFLRVSEQVAVLGSSGDEARRLLAEVGLPDSRRQDSYPHQLSGGERQRVLLAQALALRPDVILADEPTANLDGETAEAVLQAIERATEHTGAALIVASHQERVFERLRCRVERLSPKPGFPAITPQIPASKEVVLRAENVCKAYRQRDFLLREVNRLQVLNGASLTVSAGETVALVGRSGSGKSTLARCLSSREKPDSGAIMICGRDLRGVSTVTQCVQLVQQEPSESLNPRQTVLAALREASPSLGGEALEEVSLPAAWVSRRTHELSEGQRARIAIARSTAALSGGLLILDESLASLDSTTQQAVARHIRSLQARTGLGCLLITHDEELARRTAHRVMRMEQGRITA